MITGLIATFLMKLGALSQLHYIVGSEFENGLTAESLSFSEPELQKLEAAAWASAVSPENAYHPTTVRALSARLRSIADKLIGSKTVSPDGRAYILCFVVGSYVKSNLRYLDAGDGKSHTGIASDGTVVRFEERGKWINVSDFLRCSSFEGACRHSSILVRELIRLAGADLKIDPHYLGGWTRGLSGPLPLDSKPTHAWNYVGLPSGRRIVFDATGTDRTKSQWQDRMKKFWPSPDPFLLIPRSREEFENFFAFRYGTMVDGWFELADSNGLSLRSNEKLRKDPRQCLFIKMSLQDWLGTDNKFIKPLNDYIFKLASDRAHSQR